MESRTENILPVIIGNNNRVQSNENGMEFKTYAVQKYKTLLSGIKLKCIDIDIRKNSTAVVNEIAYGN